MFRNDLSFVHKYFLAEKQAALAFLILGITTVIAGLVSYFVARPNPLTMKGLAIPFFVIGLIMSIVGATVYTKADKQRKEISYQMGLEPKIYATNIELPRMEKVMNSITILLYIEAFLFLTGAGLFLFFRQADNNIWKGIGIGLVVMSAMALFLDYSAKNRAMKYEAGVKLGAGAKLGAE